MKDNFSNNQIADKLIALFELENDNQLANHFGVERQQIRQFRNGTRVSLVQAIITELLSKIEA
ncbi:hypothetical protein PN836_014770 [Ningiella sp. W23]|uniref:hypothetical protein n=1 Tax=Ningiella sp. W23 TaxID=3023715 RepID=UPI003756904E